MDSGADYINVLGMKIGYLVLRRHNKWDMVYLGLIPTEHLENWFYHTAKVNLIEETDKRIFFMDKTKDKLLNNK